MANDWPPLLKTTTRQTPEFVWPTGSTTPEDVDDQAPIPLIVGIALALFIGFVIIVCCICRRRSLSSSSNNAQESNTVYQRAPTADGIPAGGGFGAGVGGNSYPMPPGNSYPMAPMNSMYPPSTQGQQTMVGMSVGMSGQAMTGAMNIGQHLPPPQQSYPALPPNAYTPPYPMGNSPLPAYMPTSQSSHTSSASGPTSSDHGPSGFSSSSPPAPAPAPTGMMAVGNMTQPSVTLGGVVSQPRPPGSEVGSAAMETGVTSSGVMTTGYPYTIQSQAGYAEVQGQVQGQVMGPGQGMGHPGFQMSVMSQRGMMGVGGGVQGVCHGSEVGVGMGQGPGMYPPTMHHTAMDYVPGGGFIPRVGSPLPPGTTVKELDQL